MAEFNVIDLAKVLDTELAKKIYEQGLADPVQQVSGIVTDVLQGIRCFTLPFVMMARARDRILLDLRECQAKVPEDRLVQSPPEIAGPVIERLRFLEDANPLRQMYLNLLTTSIDKERQSKAHPSFPIVLSQMSRDNAVILRAINVTPKPEYVVQDNPAASPPKSNHFPMDDVVLVSHNLSLSDSDLAFPDRFLESLRHMGPFGLNLIVTADETKLANGMKRISIYISPYAKHFIETCIDE